MPHPRPNRPSPGLQTWVLLALALPLTALLADYQSTLDRYHFTWLDFDIEGSNLAKNPQASERRNAALAKLQHNNPGLLISYTLPVDPHGLSDASQKLLADAVAQGVKVH